jgi:hypothetical protein
VILIFALIGALAVGGFGMRAVAGYQDPALQPPPQSQSDIVGTTTKPGAPARAERPLAQK